MNDGTGLAARLLALDGFRVLEVSEGPDEVVITIETTADVMGCSACRVRAEAHDRMAIAVRDLAVVPLGWCGASGDGAAWARTARPRPGRSPPLTSMPRWC